MIIEHEQLIAASATTVWHSTVDVEQWPALTPTVTSVELLDGPLRLGARARLRQPGQRPTVWTVTTWEPETTFAWSAKVFGVPTVATHVIAATPDGSGCRNLLRLELSGWRGKVLGSLAGRRLRAVLATENEGFRNACEATG